jgi:hypothetical protein
MTVDQGFTWEAVASIGTRVDEKTVKRSPSTRWSNPG